MLLVKKSQSVGKPVYLPFKWRHICKEHAFVRWAADPGIWAVSVINLPNLFWRCQTAYSVVDFLFGGLKSEEKKTYRKFNSLFMQQTGASSLWKNRTQPQQSGTSSSCWSPAWWSHTAVGWHPILQAAVDTSQQSWLCWSLWHKQHTQADLTSVQWGWGRDCC